MRRLSFGLDSARLKGRRRSASGLRIETLEDRRLLATFTVLNTTDAGEGSLRAAIILANSTAGSDIINFNIPGQGVHTINLTSGALPAIVDTVTIDGTTQPLNGGSATSTPLIEVNGSTIPSTISAIADGITLALPTGTSPSTIRGLAITGFTGNGVVISGAGNNAIQGNLIGVNPTGTAASANGVGIFINGSTNNSIGGTTSTFRNIISGNTGAGVVINGSTSTGNVLQGNLIGTDVTGVLAIANANGVVITGAANNTVGGAIVASRNVIAGNLGTGVLVSGAGASGNSIQGNYIGLNQSGSAALPNLVGVELTTGAASNTVGGTASGNRNIISGNTNVQILVVGSTNNLVLGNTIGLDATGSASLGGTQGAYAGLAIQDGATGNTIGGITAAASNVISGSTGPGLLIRGQSQVGVGTVAANNLIQGNSIGTDLAGATRQSNLGGGVVLSDGTTGNTLGGTAGGLARNIISGNTGAGVALLGEATTGNLVQANSIGTLSDNTTLLGNTGDGVYVDASVNNQIGGSLAAAANTIAGNDGAGVFVNSGTRIAIRRNVIFSNDNLGIDLAPRGVNPNTTNPGVGPNDLQNYPVITSAVTSGTTTVIAGTLTSAPSQTFTVEFYSNTVQDPSGNGQGRTFVGTTNVTTDALGVASFSFPAISTVALGSFISATATDSDGNTSEFAFDAMTSAPSVDLILAMSVAPDPVAVNGVLTYTITVANNGPSNATSVLVTNTLPAGVSFIGATSSQGAIGQSGTTVTASIGTLLVGQTAVMTISVVPTIAGSITNTATVTLTEADSNLANNTASITSTAVAGVDLVVTTSATPSSATVGAPVVVTFTVTNASTATTATATNVLLSAPLPTGATVVSSSSTQGPTSTGNNTLLAAIGSLAPGVSTVVTLVLNPTATGTLTTVATVSSATPDVNPATNTAASIVPVGSAVPPIVTDGPRVLGLERAGYQQQPTVYNVLFDGPLDVASATTRANYLIVGAGRDGKIGTNDDVRLATMKPFYNATTNTVSIRTRRPVSLHKRIVFAISGTAPNGVRGTNGQLLDGENTGQPGSNFVRRFKGVGPGRILLS